MQNLQSLFALIQILGYHTSLSKCSPSPPHSSHDPLLAKYYSNLMRDLRVNWQSPIMYLKKRGYIPKNSENCLPVELGPNSEFTQAGDSGSSGVCVKPTAVGKSRQRQAPMTIDRILQNQWLHGYENSQPPAKSETAPDKKEKGAPIDNHIVQTQLQSNIDKLIELRGKVAKANKETARRYEEASSALQKIANVSSKAASQQAKMKASLVPMQNQLPLDIMLPSLNSGALKESKANASFLHNVKEKLMGLFRNKPNGNEAKKDIYTFKYIANNPYDEKRRPVQMLDKDIYYANDNFDGAKKFDREFQILLEKSLEKQQRRHDKQNSVKKKADKRGETNGHAHFEKN